MGAALHIHEHSRVVLDFDQDPRFSTWGLISFRQYFAAILPEKIKIPPCETKSWPTSW